VRWDEVRLGSDNGGVSACVAQACDWAAVSGVVHLTSDRGEFMQPTQFFIWLPKIGSDKVAVVLERNGKAD
jgi:hypothetical protein